MNKVEINCEPEDEEAFMELMISLAMSVGGMIYPKAPDCVVMSVEPRKSKPLVNFLNGATPYKAEELPP